MKIVYLSNLYGAAARGGAERVVAAEAEALAASGNQVVVISLSSTGALEEELVGAVSLIRFPAPNLYVYPDGHGRSWVIRLLWHLADIWNTPAAGRCQRFLLRESPDIVHTHNLMGLGFEIPTVIRRLGIGHVHTVHDVQLLHPSGLLAPDFEKRIGLGQRAYIAIMRRRMGSPDAVIFPSQALQDLHDHFGFFPGSNKIIIPTPAPAVLLQPRAMPTKPSFLFVGQLEVHKGIRLLLETWSRWPGAKNSQLAILGAGSLAEEVRAMAAPGIILAGPVDRDGVLAAMDRTAFLVVPSLVIENSPSVIAESLSRGTPVIAARVGGVPESVVEGRTGFLFEPGDAESLQSALGRAAAAMGDWRRYFENCCRAAGQRTPAKHVEALERVYRELKNPAAARGQ
ncbi:MAG: glycosyltransferase [Patescibacteria group bacterium]